jgi:alpha-L-rhamnosidase
MSKKLPIFSFFILAVLSAFCQSPVKPVHLTCDYILNPLGIDDKNPRLGWQMESAERNQWQTAYEICIDSNIAALSKNHKGIWNSGKIISSDNIQVECRGLEPRSFTRYYWAVRVYDGKGKVSEWSEAAWFETAMLDTLDWKARWIGDGSEQFKRDEDFYKDDPMPIFRKYFDIHRKIASARLYISGLGYYEAYLNGKKVGDRSLDPGFTSYRKEVLYSSYDITKMVSKGKNIARIALGNGWWNPLPLRLFGSFNLREFQQTGRPCVKAVIRIVYADRSVVWINTDETWQTAPGPVIKNNVYLGEHYDARREKEESAWKNAVLEEGPSGKLMAQMQPPIRVTRIINPVRIQECGKDTFLVDMGQNFAGVVRIHVNGARGTKIVLRYGEDIFSNGRLNFYTSVAGQIKTGGLSGGPGAPSMAWQEDSYILKGEGRESWNPSFTFHGFRYVEITGWPGRPGLTDIEGLRMNSDVKTNGSFSCSNEMFNQLYSTIQWTFLSNLFSVQSDCPAREKMGYGGDMVATASSFIYNYDMANFYEKAVRAFANDQQPDGGITEIAPFTGIADRGHGGKSGPLGWELAFGYLQKQLYDFYGDKRIIQDHYDAFIKQVEFLKSKAKNGLFFWDISDHEALDPKPEAFSASVFFYHHILLAAEFAGIVGKKEDSLGYANYASHVRTEIINKFWIPGTGRFDNATESAQLFALYYGLSPDPESILKVLAQEYERHAWHLSTGIFTTKMMFDVLRLYDKNDWTYRVANQRDFPGWGYMLSKGATTLWETWAYPASGPSQNHPMFGSVNEWFYRSLAGINPLAPGFKKIQIKPQPVKDLSWVKGDYESVMGPVHSGWIKTDSSFVLDVSIPVNSSAEIWLPFGKGKRFTESKMPIDKSMDVKLSREENGYAVMSVGSGKYHFEVRATAQ